MDSPLLVHLFYDFHCISKKIAQFLIILSTNILFDDLFWVKNLKVLLSWYEFQFFVIFCQKLSFWAHFFKITHQNCLKLCQRLEAVALNYFWVIKVRFCSFGQFFGPNALLVCNKIVFLTIPCYFLQIHWCFLGMFSCFFNYLWSINVKICLV